MRRTRAMCIVTVSNPRNGVMIGFNFENLAAQHTNPQNEFTSLALENYGRMCWCKTISKQRLPRSRNSCFHCGLARKKTKCRSDVLLLVQKTIETPLSASAFAVENSPLLSWTNLRKSKPQIVFSHLMLTAPYLLSVFNVFALFIHASCW